MRKDEKDLYELDGRGYVLMKTLIRSFPILLTLIVSTNLFAAEDETLLMVRSSKPFETTLEQLSAAISYNEYKISRIQRVDVGLTKSGYKTEQYRLVFFAKPSELNKLATKNPELIPYLPLKIVIFAEGDNTIMLAMSPYQLRTLVPDKTLFKYYKRWEQDIKAILESAKD